MTSRCIKTVVAVAVARAVAKAVARLVAALNFFHIGSREEDEVAGFFVFKHIQMMRGYFRLG